MTHQSRRSPLGLRWAKLSALALLALSVVAGSLAVAEHVAAKPNPTISDLRLRNLDSLVLSRTLTQWRDEQGNFATGYDWMDWRGHDCSPYSTSEHADEFEDACVRHQVLSNTLPTLDDSSGSRWN